MGKFIGHVLVTPEQADDTDLDDVVFDQLGELGTEHGQDEGWTPCACVGNVAQELTSDAVREKFGSERRQYETFIAQHPKFAHVPQKGWKLHREAAQYLNTIRDFRTQTFKEHPMRHQPEPGHKPCNGTGKIFREGIVAREGLFDHVVSLIQGRGRVEDLLPSADLFALFFPDGSRRAGAIKDVPETWQSLGTSWKVATRAILARHRTWSYVELTFVF